jgi:hypothetical protein
MVRSARRWAVATRSGMKYPRSRPSLSESGVSMADATANSMKRANSPGWNRPNPSAMFFVLDAEESRIWSLNLKSRAAGPVLTSAYTSRFNSSASCHTSRSSYRLAPGMAPAPSRTVPGPLPLHRTSNEERRTSAIHRRTIGEAARTIREASRTIREASRTRTDPRTRSEASRTNVEQHVF